MAATFGQEDLIVTFLKGWKTRIIFGCGFLAGFLDEIKVLDIKQFLVSLGVPGDKVGVVMIGMSMLGILLREITNGPPAPVTPPKDPV